MNKYMKCVALLMLLPWAVGVGGGIGYSIYHGHEIIAVCVAFVALLSWPTVADIIRNLKK